MLPFENNKYHIGSTYKWDKIDGNTSEKGLKELISKLESVVNISYKVISHKAGIRPTVADRRPLIGKSETNSKILFFNGLGTKGVMIAPYFSEIFAEYLIGNIILINEVDIKRYF